MWYAINATRFHQVDTIPATIGPAGEASHTHHIVMAFHNRNVRAAHPSMAKASLFELEYCALMSNSGTKPTNIVIQLAPHQLIDRRVAEASARTSLLFFEICRLNCITLQI